MLFSLSVNSHESGAAGHQNCPVEFHLLRPPATITPQPKRWVTTSQSLLIVFVIVIIILSLFHRVERCRLTGDYLFELTENQGNPFRFLGEGVSCSCDRAGNCAKPRPYLKRCVVQTQRKTKRDEVAEMVATVYGVNITYFLFSKSKPS